MENQRNYSIDLLRIFSMTLVSCIHFLCYNGLWDNSDMPAYNRLFCDILVTLTYSFVNLFVMMSGYLLCEKDFKLSRIVNTWTMVWIGCVSTAIIVCLICPNVICINGIIRSAFPILTASYWYIISYFFLLLVAPFINKAMAMSSAKTLRNVLLGICVLVLIYMNFNPLINTNTYVGPDTALPWFCYMYAIGAYIRKYSISRYVFITFLGILSFTILLATKYFHISFPQGLSILNTSSLFSVLLAVSLFVSFIKFGSMFKLSPKILGGANLLGKSSLLVYIIQENYLFREWYWQELNPIQYKDSPTLILAWIFTVILFWILAVIMYKWYEVLQKLFVGKIEYAINKWVK